MNKTSPIRILIADQHRFFIDGFKSMLNRIPEFKLVGEALEGDQLIRLAKILKPDIVITAIHIQGIDGIQATKMLINELPLTGVIALSNVEEIESIAQILDAGAKAFISKNSDVAEIVAAVKSVYNGIPYYCKLTTEKLIKMLAKKDQEKFLKGNGMEFNKTEIEIIKLICKQYSNKEIGEKLFLSKRTIEWHRKLIMQKLEAKNTVGIIIYAIKNNLIDFTNPDI